ncbi:hypothetical protein DLAC_08166 [Tieghemostelium lacteum]|uniref:Uncharacterized protein n=1 Tax=Tieghemostelium lacteum TaxID=361077 RepID=A0A151ZBB2_TIELA|nr:hypothetical protein DLAC_08166 [Tieghemostelium lacteum]|eukprot:KYQ91237.1 hypothetical protein DLAC_08166 [Tieghemostelium lacteum]
MRIHIRTQIYYSGKADGPWKVVNVSPTDKILILAIQKGEHDLSTNFYYANNKLDMSLTFQQSGLREGCIIETCSNPLLVIFLEFIIHNEIVREKKTYQKFNVPTNPTLIHAYSLRKAAFQNEVAHFGERFGELDRHFTKSTYRYILDLICEQFETYIYNESNTDDPISNLILRLHVKVEEQTKMELENFINDNNINNNNNRNPNSKLYQMEQNLQPLHSITYKQEYVDNSLSIDIDSTDEENDVIVIDDDDDDDD